MAPTIADIEAARERLAGVARETPLYPTETFSRLSRTPGLPQGGEPPAHGLVQDPRRLQHDRDARRGGAARGRRRRERRQPRPGGRLGRARGGHPGDDLHAAGRADGEGRGDALVRGRDGARRRGLRGGGRRCGRRTSTRTGATLVHAFEDERVIAGPGRRSASSSPSRRPTRRPSRPDRRRRACRRNLARAEGAPARRGRRRCRSASRDTRSRTASRSSTRASCRRRSSSACSTTRVSVSDDEISEALVLCVERTKLLVEGAGAVGLAALLAGRVAGDGPVAVVLSGGNIDATTLISVLRHGLTEAGRFLAIRLLIPDRPGELRNVLDLIARGSRQRRLRRPPPRRADDDRAADRDRDHRLDEGRRALPGASRGDSRRGVRCRTRRAAE